MRFAGEPSIPILEEIAFGRYDWTQVKALRALYIMAAQGLRTEEIVDEIAEHLDQFRNDVFMSTLEGLSRVKGHPKVLAILEKYIEEYIADGDDPPDTLLLIRYITRCKSEAGMKYHPLCIRR